MQTTNREASDPGAAEEQGQHADERVRLPDNTGVRLAAPPFSTRLRLSGGGRGPAVQHQIGRSAHKKV